MTNRSRSVAAAFAMVLLIAINGSSTALAGSPPKMLPSVDIQAVMKSADEATRSGDYSEALRLYRQAAEKGDARAQTTVGVMYLDSDPKEALKWFKLAAAQGNADAEFRLGWMYATGTGVPQDKNEAVKWYQLAAGRGHEEAQYTLGIKTRAATPVSTVVPQTQRTSPNDRRAQITAALEQCNSAAKSGYQSAWDDNCARIHKREQDNYYTCLQKHPGNQYNNDPWNCGRIYTTDTETSDCRLPMLLADSLKHDFERAQDLCLKAYELGSR